jgi:hypothetical protein
VRATRLLAETAIGDAIAAHGDRKDIAKANADLAPRRRDPELRERLGARAESGQMSRAWAVAG